VTEKTNIRESIQELDRQCRELENGLSEDVRTTIEQVLQVEQAELGKYAPQYMGEKIVDAVRKALKPNGLNS